MRKSESTTTQGLADRDDLLAEEPAWPAPPPLRRKLLNPSQSISPAPPLHTHDPNAQPTASEQSAANPSPTCNRPHQWQSTACETRCTSCQTLHTCALAHTPPPPPTPPAPRPASPCASIANHCRAMYLALVTCIFRSTVRLQSLPNLFLIKSSPRARAT